MIEEELPPGESFRDEEFPDEDQEEGSETRPCPECGRSIYIDAPRCPGCGNDVTPGAGPAGRKPWWIWIGITLAGAGITFWLVSC